MNVLPRVAIVTGAASGIGRHWAGVLAAMGDEYRLALADVNSAGLCVAFAPSDRVRLHELDVRSVEQWQRVVDDTLRRFGRIDYLFNIAGGGLPGFLLDVPMQLVDTTIDVNLKGQIYGMKIVGPIMVRQGAGHIVNVASLAGVSPTPGNEVYSAAKFGLRAVSLATAIRLRPSGVFVTVVCPDLVDTPALTRHLELNPEDVALIHSGPGALTTVDVERAFFRAMRKRPLEVLLPRWRGWLAKINNLCPPLMLRFYGPLMRRGLRRLAERKRERRDIATTTANAVLAAPDGLRTVRAPAVPQRPQWSSVILRAAVSVVLGRLARREISGLENIPRRGPCLIVFNQMSLFDTPLISVLIRRRDVTGLVARDYRRNPFYRVLIEYGGGMWIRRSSSDRRALKAALAALDRGWVVEISPEGRRSPTSALVQGKPGPAFLAKHSGVSIVPVALANTENMARSLRRLQRPKITIRVGEPFRLAPFDGRSRKEQLREDTDRIMCHIAALLPPEYHGAYAGHPYLERGSPAPEVPGGSG